jgi:cold shock CspA family protein
MSERQLGKVVHWNVSKKFGFIAAIDRIATRGDIFVHISEVEGEEPRIGDAVTFSIGADRRPGREARLCAKAVRFVSADAQNENHSEEGGAGASALADGLMRDQQ